MSGDDYPCSALHKIILKERRIRSMEVFIHYPSTPEGLKKLHHEAAVLHAQYVSSRIRKLPCSKEQKLQLVDAIIQKIKEEDSTA
jgi:hypothetical protein